MDPKQHLQNLGIKFKAFTHMPVFTCKEARQQLIYKQIKGIPIKNLFIKDRKSNRFYLVIMPAEKPLAIKQLEKTLNEKLKFANEHNLKEILGLTPGSVSPLGLLNDNEHSVTIVIDKDIWNAEYVSFHPNINTETVEMKGEDFQKYIKSLENKLIFLQE